MEEVELKLKHIVVTPVLCESSNARKKAEHEQSPRIHSSSADSTEAYTNVEWGRKCNLRTAKIHGNAASSAGQARASTMAGTGLPTKVESGGEPGVDKYRGGEPSAEQTTKYRSAVALCN